MTPDQLVNPEVRIFRAIVIKNALSLWHRHKIKANSAYTPSAMMDAAESITGRTFAARDYPAAIAALNEHIAAHVAALRTVDAIKESLHVEG